MHILYLSLANEESTKLSFSWNKYFSISLVIFLIGKNEITLMMTFIRALMRFTNKRIIISIIS